MPTYRYRLTPKEVLKVRRLIAEDVPIAAIALRFQVSARTICYYKPIGAAQPPAESVPKRITRGPLTGTPLLACIMRPPAPLDDDQPHA